MINSIFTNNYIICRKDDGPLFEANKHGLVVVKINNYLLAPRELFSERQLHSLAKKHHAANRDTSPVTVQN